MPQATELIGRTFSRLTVIGLSEGRCSDGSLGWICECACGGTKVVSSHKLRTGNDQSCGCLRRELAGGHAPLKHGNTANGVTTPEYRCWSAMKQRCLNPKRKIYKDYGGRGITVCDRWLESFANFLADMGPRPSPDLSLDRIDNDGNYEPGNCRWATAKEQSNNRRARRRLTA